MGDTNNTNKITPRLVDEVVELDDGTQAALLRPVYHALRASMDERAAKFMNYGFSGPGKEVIDALLRGRFTSAAQQVRDNDLYEFPLLPQAVKTFMEIASSREWTVTGRPRAASRAVEKLNRAVYVDMNGVVHESWQEFVQREVLDWLIFGKSFFLVPRLATGRRRVWGAINYVDPAEVVMGFPKIPVNGNRVIGNYRTSALHNQKLYIYDERTWGYDEMFVHTALPTSTSAVGPVLMLIPSAMLLYYLREHDTVNLDGRKLRDIFLTVDDNMRDALAQAMSAAASFAGGFDPTKQGIPVVSLNLLGSIAAQTKIADLIHRIGLSEVPDGLDREDLWLRIANEISGALGLPLRVWYEDPRGTNRSLERVTQERSRVKGPAYFNRSLERLINNGRFLGNVRFNFAEEQDPSIERVRADIVETWAKAINYLYATFGGVIDLSVLWQILQRNGLVFDDPFLQQQLVTMDGSPVTSRDMLGAGVDVQPTIPEGSVAMPETDAPQLSVDTRVKIANAPRIRLSASQEEAFERMLKGLIDTDNELGENEVRLDMDGRIVEKRRRVFHIADVINEDTKRHIVKPVDPAWRIQEGWAETLDQVRKGDDEDAENE